MPGNPYHHRSAGSFAQDQRAEIGDTVSVGGDAVRAVCWRDHFFVNIKRGGILLFGLGIMLAANEVERASRR